MNIISRFRMSHYSIMMNYLALVHMATFSPHAIAAEAHAVIHGDQDAGLISRHIYGHFAEHLGR